MKTDENSLNEKREMGGAKKIKNFLPQPPNLKLKDPTETHSVRKPLNVDGKPFAYFNEWASGADEKAFDDL